MNDKSELWDGIGFLRQALESPPESLFYEGQYLQQAVEFLDGELASYTGNVELEDALFSMSLSSSDDLLSQWRAYGGYSIKLDSRWLSDVGIEVVPCVYEKSQKIARARSAITDALVVVSADLASSGGSIGTASMDQLIELVHHAAVYKNDGFREEGEVRIVMDSSRHPVKFRPRGTLLIPYIEIDVPRETICGVRVGPIRDQDLAYGSMGLYAGQVETMHRADGGYSEYWIQVEKSVIPYRE
ncbi:hypothetical protein [Pseudoxanthomonas mexicana]|uniref:hypothetical protein n=1 Tax=Pseudoxanthomonas mexicana TaxID=128785 RepID=UPI0028ABE66D|nr:hypothetical protein [Pseudoxanthomonas mexicana]